MKINNKKLIIIFGILCLCILLIGVSFALYTVSLNSIKKARLKAGTLSLQILDEDNNVISNSNGSNYEVNSSFIDIEDTYPKTNTQGLEQDGFPFKIKNNGTLAASYNLYIKVLDDSTLDESNIKYSLTRNGNPITETPQLITEADLEEDNTYKYYKIDLGELGKQETVSYNLKLWLNIDAGTDVIGKEFKASLYVKAEQWDSALPPGYTELEYLESTGTQYIDTEIIGKTGVSIEATFKVLDLTKTRTIGVTDGINRLSLLLPTAGTGYLVNQIGNINKIVTTHRLNVGDTATTKQDGGKLYLNGELIDTVTPNTFNTNMTIYMFAQHANQMVSFDISRIYNVKIWENGELVRNFIPCLDNTGTPCMYDTVTKTCFYNQGTGEFLYKIKN